jgi:glycosyltransferase involved in cell wall biosynthesis
VVVDTGSTDATREIARRHGAVLYDFPWIDDFGAARQFAFDQASGDWVFWVDADDVVLHADRIRDLAALAPEAVIGIHWRYVLSRDAAGEPTFEFWRERLVRNDGSFRWAGRVHEALVAQRPGQQIQSDEVVVEHHPKPEDPSDQIGRNLRILEAEYAEHDGDLEPRKLFYLGREYADHGQNDQAIATLERYVTVATWADEHYIALMRLCALYAAESRYDQAIDANLAALKLKPRWPDAYFGLARAYYFLGDWANVIHWSDLGRQMPPPDTTLFVNPADYRHAWIIYYTNALYRTGDVAGALEWSKRGRELDPDNSWHRSNVQYFGRLLDSPRVALDRSLAPHYPSYAVIPVRDRHELTSALLDQLALPADRIVLVDNGSTTPARDVFAGRARVVDHPERNISALWNAGLDLIAAEHAGPYNIAVLNNDLSVPPGFLSGLANGLRARPDHLIAYPDHERRLPAGICDSVGRMSGFAFMVRGEAGLRLDPQFVWWYGDDDLARQARERGQVVCVGGLHLEHLEPNHSTEADPALQALARDDQARFEAKWGALPGS